MPYLEGHIKFKISRTKSQAMVQSFYFLPWQFYVVWGVVLLIAGFASSWDPLTNGIICIVSLTVAGLYSRARWLRHDRMHDRMRREFRFRKAVERDKHDAEVMGAFGQPSTAEESAGNIAKNRKKYFSGF